MAKKQSFVSSNCHQYSNKIKCATCTDSVAGLPARPVAQRGSASASRAQSRERTEPGLEALEEGQTPSRQHVGVEGCWRVLADSAQIGRNSTDLQCDAPPDSDQWEAWRSQLKNVFRTVGFISDVCPERSGIPPTPTTLSPSVTSVCPRKGEGQGGSTRRLQEGVI